MYIEALAFVGLLTASCEGRWELPRRAQPAGYSNSTLSATSNSTTSSSTSQSGTVEIYTITTTTTTTSTSTSSSSTSESGTPKGYITSSSSPAVYSTSSSLAASAGNSSSQSSSSASSSSVYSTPPYSSIPYHYSPSSVGPGTAPVYSRPGGTAPVSYNPSPIGPGTAPGTAPYTSKSIIPTGTGDGALKPNGTVPVQGHHPQCSGETLNVLGASLDWWYTRTLYNVVSVLSVSYDRNLSTNVWTLLPETTPFDLTAALATPTCETSYTFNTIYNTTVAASSCTPAPTPVAASTTVISQTAYKQINATSGEGNAPNVISTPKPAALTIPDGGGKYSAGTAFVYFSKYEIVTKRQNDAGCVTATNTYNMAEPFSFEYSDGSVNGSKAVGAGVTGDVNPAFLNVVGASKAEAGSWVADPTVALVVQDVVQENHVLTAAIRPGFAPRLTTETVLQTPSATLPTFNTPTPPQTTPKKPPQSPTNGNVQKTQKTLQTPNPPPKNPTPGSGPGQTQKPKPPNSPPGNPQQTPGKPGAKPTTTNALSVLQSAENTIKHNNGPGPGPGKPGGKPTTTNALSVLESAEETVKHTNPTGAAIIHGLQPHHTPAPETPSNGNPGPANPVPPGEKNGVGTGPNGKPVVVVDGTTFTGNSHTQFVLGPGETLTPGGSVQMHGHTVSLAPSASAIVVDGHTHAAAAPMITPPPVLTIGGHPFAPNAGTTYNIRGQQLTPGGTITVDGSTIALAPGGTALVVNGVTRAVSNVNGAAPPVLTLGGHAYTAINSGATYVVDGKTLVPGGVIVVDGTTVSLSPGATAVVVDGHTQVLNPAAGITAPPVLSVDGQTFTAINNGGTFVVEGQTLTPGGVIVVDGTTVSLAPGATAVVINGHTSYLAAASITAAPVLTIGSETFTAVNGGYTYVINGETLTPGEEETVTVDGTTYIVSLYPGATVLKIETEGPNGKVTATTLETLYPGGSPATVTVDASAGASPGSGPSASVSPALSNMASSTTLHLSGLCFAIGTFILAIWL